MAIHFLLYNHGDYLALKDDMFLDRMESLYDEESLLDMLDTVEEIMENGCGCEDCTECDDEVSEGSEGKE
jgi:hypothetical protein